MEKYGTVQHRTKTESHILLFGELLSFQVFGISLALDWCAPHVFSSVHSWQTFQEVTVWPLPPFPCFLPVRHQLQGSPWPRRRQRPP